MTETETTDNNSADLTPEERALLLSKAADLREALAQSRAAARPFIVRRRTLRFGHPQWKRWTGLAGRDVEGERDLSLVPEGKREWVRELLDLDVHLAKFDELRVQFRTVRVALFRDAAADAARALLPAFAQLGYQGLRDMVPGVDDDARSITRQEEAEIRVFLRARAQTVPAFAGLPVVVNAILEGLRVPVTEIVVFLLARAIATFYNRSQRQDADWSVEALAADTERIIEDAIEAYLGGSDDDDDELAVL